MDTSVNEPSSRPISPFIDRTAAYTWRLLVIAAGVALLAIVFYQFRVVTVPVFIALLLTTLLLPPVRRLERAGLKPGLATSTVFIGVVAVLLGIGYLLASPISDEFQDLGPQLEEAVEDVNDWLVTGPLELEQAELDRYVDDIIDKIQENAGALSDGVITSATLAAEVFAGTILAIILTFFFVKDGDRLVSGIVNAFPTRHRALMLAAGERAFHTLGSYLRGVAATGVVDAALIGIALVVLDVPLVFPLVALTFFGAFFPVVGATIAGALAAAVALVNGGFGDMIAVIVVVLVVQQLEAHLLQPLLVGRATALHPVMVLLALGMGAILAGLLGAFMAVPTVAVIGAVVREVSMQRTAAQLASAGGPDIGTDVGAGVVGADSGSTDVADEVTRPD